MKIKTFVINLAESTGRREWMEVQLKQFPELDVEFIEATDGRTMPVEILNIIYDKNAAILNLKRELSKGEIGACYSHLRIYTEIIQNDIPFAIILEDDALLSAFFIDTIKSIINYIKIEIPQIILFTPVSDYSRSGSIILSKTHERSLVTLKNDAYYAAGYLLNKKAAEVLVHELVPIHTIPDNWGYFIQNKKIDIKAIIPNVVGLCRYAYNGSVIDSDPLRKEEVFGKKLVKKSIALRLVNKIKKMLINKLKRNIRNKSNVWYNKDGIVFPNF